MSNLPYQINNSKRPFTQAHLMGSSSFCSGREPSKIAQAGVPANRSSFAGWRASRAQPRAKGKGKITRPRGGSKALAITTVFRDRAGVHIALQGEKLSLECFSRVSPSYFRPPPPPPYGRNGTAFSAIPSSYRIAILRQGKCIWIGSNRFERARL